MHRQALERELGELLSVAEFTDYCPNGIQVEGKDEIRKVGVAVSASLAAIQRAADAGCDALLVHHGIFWNKDPYPLIKVKKQKVEKLLASGISLFAYHLPLDAHPQLGNNWKAAIDLKWEAIDPFLHVGVKARLKPRPVEVFQKELEIYYQHPAHTALGGKKEISRVALVSGGAHRSLDLAADAGVDAYITGSFDEMIWDIAHERGIHFFALGHYATERVGVLALMHHLEERMGLECVWIDLPNPF